jgi:hypothetical protein
MSQAPVEVVTPGMTRRPDHADTDAAPPAVSTVVTLATAPGGKVLPGADGGSTGVAPGSLATAAGAAVRRPIIGNIARNPMPAAAPTMRRAGRAGCGAGWYSRNAWATRGREGAFDAGGVVLTGTHVTGGGNGRNGGAGGAGGAGGSPRRARSRASRISGS